MGPLEENNISELTLRPINPDGTYGDPIEFESIENVTYSLDENVEGFYDVGFDLAEGSDMMFSGTLMLPYKKMSRKKFKKWLMSFPIYERNEADRWCRFIGCAKGRVGYFRTYFDTLLVPYSFDLMQAIVKQLKETKK